MSTTSSNPPNTTATSLPPIKINPEQAVSLAALILADENLAVTPEKLQILLKAAGITEIEPIWTTLFAKALDGKNVKHILTAVDTPGPGAGSETLTAPINGHDLPNDGSGDEAIELISDSEDDAICGLGLFD